MIPIFPASDAVGAPNDQEVTPMPAPTARRAPEWVASFASLVERALWTWVQAFAVALLGTTFFETLDFGVAAAAAVATVPAGITVALAAVNAWVTPDHWPPIAQVVFRTIRTGAATFLGFLAAGTWVLDLDGLRALVAAGLAAAMAAVLAAIKAELATFVGVPGSVSTLPASLDPARFNAIEVTGQEVS